MCPEVGSPPSILVLNFDQIFSTVLAGFAVWVGLSQVIYKQQHPPDGAPKHPLDLLMLAQFVICACGTFWIIGGIALPWGNALENWYYPTHNALANSVDHGCSLKSFIAINDAMNRVYGQASQIQSTLIPIALIVGVCSFAILALYARVVRGSWSWIGQFFITSHPGVHRQHT